MQDNGGTGNGGVDLDPTARTMTMNVTAVNDAPVLSGSNNLTAINEDPGSNPGTLVSALIAGQTSDVDCGCADRHRGHRRGQHQRHMAVLDQRRDDLDCLRRAGHRRTARLLAADANTYVRFVPNANWNGTVSNGLTFRAWDQTSGSAGNTADTTTNGGTSAFSTATASASITVNSVNDAPAGASKTVTTLEDTAYTFAAVGLRLQRCERQPGQHAAGGQDHHHAGRGQPDRQRRGGDALASSSRWPTSTAAS